MKKIIVVILICLFLAQPVYAFNEAELKQQYILVLQTLISLLVKQVEMLQIQLIELQTQQAELSLVNPNQYEWNGESTIVEPEPEKIKWQPCYNGEFWSYDEQKCICCEVGYFDRQNRRNDYMPPTSQKKCPDGYEYYAGVSGHCRKLSDNELKERL